jgi:hypothetical protein
MSSVAANTTTTTTQKKARTPKAATAVAATPAPVAVSASVAVPDSVAVPAPAAKKPRAKKAVPAPEAVPAPAVPAPVTSAPATETAPVAEKPKRRRVVVKKDKEVKDAAAPRAKRVRPPVPQYTPLPKITDFSEESVTQARAFFQWFARHATRNRLIRLYKDIALQVYNELRQKSRKMVDVAKTELNYNNRLSNKEFDGAFKSLNGVWLSDFSIQGKYTLEEATNMLRTSGKIGENEKSRRLGILLSQCAKRKVKPLGVVSEARGDDNEYKFNLGADESKRVYVGPTIKFKKLNGHTLSFQNTVDSVFHPREKLPRGTRRVTSLFPTVTKKKVPVDESSSSSSSVPVPATL